MELGPTVILDAALGPSVNTLHTFGQRQVSGA